MRRADPRQKEVDAEIEQRQVRTPSSSNHRNHDGSQLARTPAAILVVHRFEGMDAAGIDETVFDRALSASLPVWRYDRGGVEIGETPGIYGDFSLLASQSIQVTGWMIQTTWVF